MCNIELNPTLLHVGGDNHEEAYNNVYDDNNTSGYDDNNQPKFTHEAVGGKRRREYAHCVFIDWL